ncbi:MAG TPA: alpha/beta hydrolase [Jiangellaceae bacterium]
MDAEMMTTTTMTSGNGVDLATASGLVDIGATRLYCEAAGDGPSLLFIPGGLGDAGEWAAVMAQLASSFTVVAYDRRGFSRSDKPNDMTTLADHADDAVALMRALSLGPAAVVSQSSGALITADLVARHPRAVRSAVLFEAPLFGIVPGNEGVIANLQRLVEEKMTSGGPRAAMEAFIRANAGDDVYDALRAADPETLERCLDNGAHFFRVELPAIPRFTPNVTTIKSSGVPLTVLLGSDDRDTWYGKAATWLAAQLGTNVVETPGGHAAMWTHPVEFAAAVRRTAA